MTPDALRTPHGADAASLEASLAPEFRLLRPLGDGAMAHVYLVREIALERLVAVKVLRSELASDAVVRQRFTREARAAARIVHPNVVVVHRVGELADGVPWLIMEYIEGRTLDDVLAAEGPLPLEQARTLLAQIAGALAAAHQKGVIHRDVRPGNILLEHDTGRAVLSDFGLSGIKETGSEAVTRLTQVGEALGDPRYSSPEQLLGDTVTDATDIYSFGVVAYEAIGGGGPHDAATPREQIAAKLQRPPRLLREMRPDVPPSLERLLERCLARKPEHRPRSAEVRLLLDQQDGAAADGVNAHEPPFIPALSSFLAELRRRRVYRAAAAYLAIAFVALQGADIVLPALPLPAWTLTALVVLTLTGFPVVLVLTWIYDLNRGGLERTPDAAASSQLPGDRIARRALQLAGIGLSLLVAGLLAWWVFD